jgi:hypothetical protein
MLPILLSCVSLAAATLLAQDPMPAPPVPTPAAPATKPALAHSFFIAGPDFTGILDEQGKIMVDTHQPGARDGWVLPNGNLLIAWSKLLVESTREGKVVFQYALSADNQELGTVQRLPSGNTLVTELGKQPRLHELDASGKVVVTVPLLPETDNGHMQTRMARKLANGNYLVPHLLAFQVKEYTPKGEVVAVLHTDLPELGGKKVDNWPFTAIRVDSGNTLCGLTHGNKVAEFDAKGKIVWLLTNDDLPGAPIADACGVQRLANGNTVVACYAQTKPDGIKLFEVTPEKKIVWSYAGPRRVHHFQVLTTNGVAEPAPARK